jgi:hypothetical protein
VALNFPHLPVHQLEDVTLDLESLLAWSKTVEQATNGRTVAPGGWAQVTELKKLESGGGFQPFRIRLEQAGTVVRLRGGVKATAAIKTAEQVALFPVGYRPPTQVLIMGAAVNATFVAFTLGANGELIFKAKTEAPSNEIAEGSSYSFDGVTFNLTT